MTYISKTVYLLCFILFLSCTKNNQESIVSFRDGGGLTDVEGNAYPTVIIENNNGWSQEWMQVNLKTSSYNDGTPITQAISRALFLIMKKLVELHVETKPWISSIKASSAPASIAWIRA